MPKVVKKENKFQKKGGKNITMKEIKRKGKYGCSITIRFAEQPNIQAEDNIMRILVDSFE